MTIEDVLFSWGAWRHREFRTPRKHTFIGSGVVKSYWQRCKFCLGTGKDGKAHCFACRGRKGRKVLGVSVDPAGIRSTGPGGMYVTTETPKDYTIIEDALDSLGIEARLVVESRYVVYPKKYARKGQIGGKEIRLSWVNGRLDKKIGARRYSHVLHKVKRRLAEILGY